MAKNFYFEEVSGKFEDFDYNINTDISENGVADISAFINHSRINFNDMVNDFRAMLSCIKSYYEVNSRNLELDVINPDNKEFEIDVEPSKCGVSIKIFAPDFNQEKLVQQFAYSVGYVQSFLLHREVIHNNSEENEGDE